MSEGPLTVAMVVGMPYPMAKVSCIWVGHLVGGFDAQKAKYYTWPNKLRADTRLMRAMIRQPKTIDIIHCHTIEGLGIALAFKALTLSRAPICMDVHGPVVAELVHYRLIPAWRPVVAAVNGLESAMLSFVGHAFVPNDGLRNLLLQRLPSDRVTTVFDYVDLEHFDSGGRGHSRLNDLLARHKSGGKRLLAYAGMFKDYKGVDHLIRAFADLAARHPDLRLILIGDGPCRADYEQLIGQLGNGEKVHMLGLVPHSDVVNWLAIADVVVSPTSWSHRTTTSHWHRTPRPGIRWCGRRAKMSPSSHGRTASVRYTGPTEVPRWRTVADTR